MRALIASALLILIGATLAVAQKRSDKQDYDLIGPVKVVHETSLSFDYDNGKYSELPSGAPGKMVRVFDREGTVLYSAAPNFDGIPSCGWGYGAAYFDPSKRVYDSSGNLVEYMPGDTLEHSSYRLKNIYDAQQKLIETEHYDPYTLRYKLLYTYENVDDHGNWTIRTITPIVINSQYEKLWKTLEYRIITYY